MQCGGTILSRRITRSSRSCTCLDIRDVVLVLVSISISSVELPSASAISMDISMALCIYVHVYKVAGILHVISSESRSSSIVSSKMRYTGLLLSSGG